MRRKDASGLAVAVAHPGRARGALVLTASLFAASLVGLVVVVRRRLFGSARDEPG